MKNLQGDVVAILDSAGTAVVEYAYDAWGNILTTTGTMASTLGQINPLTYRGYVYDHETGLYYLQSRYYDPEVGRFLNADAFTSTGQGILGNNMFAYCGNNPVNFSDPSGSCACTAVGLDDNFAASHIICPNCGYSSGTGGVPIGLGEAFDWVSKGAAQIVKTTFKTIAYSFTVAGAYTQDSSRLQLAEQSPPDGPYQYWEAYRFDGNVYVGRGLSLWGALIRVDSELDVMCSSRDAALLLIQINGYTQYVGPEIDRGREHDSRYYYHYHALRDANSHIWYYGS